MSFVSELKRRNVVKVAIAYAAISWLLIQLVTTVEEPLGLPPWFDTFIIVCLAVGLPVALVLAWAFELTPEGIKLTESVEADASITPQTGRKLNRITIAILSVAVALLLLDRFVLQTDSTSPAPTASTGVLPNSIAVLPLENLSPNEEDAFFAIGLHEEILNQLAKLRNMNVIARTTMSQYANTDKTLDAIARELNVETVMEGNVRYANDRVRVTAQLIDGQNGVHLWSETYEEPFEDIFAIESDIAMSVANAMAVEFSLDEQETIEQVPTDSPQAYALYLEANALSFRQTAASTALGIEKIDQALALDPEFALAWATKAWLHFWGQASFPLDYERHLRDGEAAAKRAIDLDPELGNAHSALASIYASRGELLQAEVQNRLARQIGVGSNPFISMVVGFFDEPQKELEEFVLTDPLWPSVHAGLILVNDFRGNLEEAIAAYEHGTDLFGDWFGHWNAIHALLGADEGERALDIARRYPRYFLFADIDDPLNDSDAALQAIRNYSTAAEGNNPQKMISASWAAYFGDQDLALADITAAADMNIIGPGSAFWTPLFREVRQLDRFKEYLRQKGFVAYWRSYGWPDLCRPLQGDNFVCD